MLTSILTALLVLCVIVLIVLVTVFQHGNEGGIGSSLGGGNSSGFFGASGGANIIVRATWICGSLLFILATSLAWVKTNNSFGVSREIESALEAPPPSANGTEAAASASPAADLTNTDPAAATVAKDAVPATSPAPAASPEAVASPAAPAAPDAPKP